MLEEKIKIVDENDEAVGGSTLFEALQKGSYYDVVDIIIEDEAGDILLQKRSSEKSSYPNCWTGTARGHVHQGETYERAAAREIRDELDLDMPLEYVGKVLVQAKTEDKTINQFNTVFRGVISRATKLTLNLPDSEARWFTREELNEKVMSAPEEFAPAFVEIVEEFYMLEQ